VVVAVVLVVPQDQPVLVDQALAETAARLIQTGLMAPLIEVAGVVELVVQARQPETEAQVAQAL
jgi:hypothetical protein